MAVGAPAVMSLEMSMEEHVARGDRGLRTPRARGITMSASSVLKLLANPIAKTQTRRILEAPPHGPAPAQWSAWEPGVTAFKPGQFGLYVEGAATGAWGLVHVARCPWGCRGDQLWVRETWKTEERASDMVDGIRFKSDGTFVPIKSTREAADRWVSVNREGWRTPHFMPKWASRLWLEITDIRVERLRDISEEDAIAEGLSKISKDGGITWKYGIPDMDGLPGTDDLGMPWADWNVSARVAFQRVWERIHGTSSRGTNPWCWAISFRRIRP